MRGERCEEISAWLVDFADSDLPEPDRGRVEAHVSDCAACRAELGRLHRSLELARSVWQENASRALSLASIQSPRVAARGLYVPTRIPLSAQGSISSRRLVAAAAAGAAAVLVVLGAWLLWRPGGGGEVASVPSVPSVRDGGPEGAVEMSPGGAAPAGEVEGSSGGRSPAGNTAPPEDLDVEAIIAREGRAARLAAAIAFLATEPSLKEYRERAERYLQETYPEAAAARPAGPPEKLPVKEPKS